MADQRADVTWRDGRVPVSVRFDDPYFSLEHGLEETRHVFLGGNGLPDRFRAGFRIAELGFGTGLNLLAAWSAWREAGVAGRLRYVSFEAFPMAADDMAAALAGFPEVEDLAAVLVSAWCGGALRIETEDLEAEVVLGDVRETLTRWDGAADAWFLDGFAPAKNPEMWGAGVLAGVAAKSAPGATVATYSAAGEVRRGLVAAGFAVERRPGYGRKRHMTAGRLG